MLSRTSSIWTLGFLLLDVGLSAQVITTVAGTQWTFPDVNVPAIGAPLSGDIYSLGTDTKSNIIICDTGNSLIFSVSQAGILSVIAGNGSLGYSGDGGPATEASLSYPYDVTYDSAGNLYIADFGSYAIRKVSSDGIISTVFHTNQPPTAVAVSPNGTIYFIGDPGPVQTVFQWTPGGTVTAIAGNGQSGFSGDGGPAVNATLNYPSGLAVDSAGNLYIADTLNNRVRVIAPNGIISTALSFNSPQRFARSGGKLYVGGYGGVAGINGTVISAIANRSFTFDNNGEVVYTTGGNYVNKIVSGSSVVIAGSTGVYRYSGDGGPATAANLQFFQFRTAGRATVAVDASGDLYIADTQNYRVRKVTPDGVIRTVAGTGAYGYSGDQGPATSAKIGYVTSVAVDKLGNLFFADGTYVREVSSSGTIKTVAGGGTLTTDGVPAVQAALQPNGIAIDASGNVYVSSGNFVRKVANNGTISTVAGTGQPASTGDGGSATSASLNGPAGLAVDASGNLYIAEEWGSLVRKVSSAGIISTVAGSGSGTTPATKTTLDSPYGLAIDSAGNIYIGDSYGGKVLRVGPDGAIQTLAGSGSWHYFGDGGLATQAGLGPAGVAIDAAGNLYIADEYNSRVRKVIVSTQVKFDAAPTSLNFSANGGGLTTAAQNLTLSSSISGLEFNASTSANWLNMSLASGSIPTVLQVSVNPVNLTAGSYQGTITISVPNAVPPTSTIAVTLTVSADTPAGLGVSTQNVSFIATQGGAALTQQLQIIDTGGGSLSFAAATSGGSWLRISAASGTAAPSSPTSLTITATPGSLALGTYSGTVAITGAGSTINIPVTLSISAPAAVMLVSQTGLSFTAVAQGGVPLPQTFGILNTGQGSMSWSATASTLSGGNWLQISPASGTVQQPYLDVSLVNVSIDPRVLSTGTYYGRIQVSASAANTPQLITVIVKVLPAGTSLGPQLYPAGLIFTGVAGVTPGSQDVQIANPTANVNSFQSGQIGSGFSFLPTNASLEPTQPTTLRVFPDFSNLSAGGTQRGTITLQFSDGSPAQTINVLSVVAPSGVTPNSANGSTEKAKPRASGCGGLPLSVQFRSLQPNFTAALGQATSVDIQVADACGNLVGPPSAVQGGTGSQSLYYVTASLTNGDPQVVLTPLGNGIWQGTWKPVSAAGAVTLIVNAGGPNGTGQNKVSGTVIAPAPSAITPTVTAQGVLHAASDQGGGPISPGELVTIYGMNLADQTGQSSGLPLQTQLGGTQVLLGNQPLPILYSSAGQLNVQVPYSVPVNTQSLLTVQHGNSLSLPQPLVVALAQPGIFTVNQQGTGQGSIVRSDGVTLAQPGTPAAIGETVVIYCAGLGAVMPAAKEGAPAPSMPPLATTVNKVTVTIGGQPAQLTFSGLTPGFAGLYQVNAIVPSGITTGDAVPVIMTAAGQTSPPVTMAVQ